MLIIGLFYGTGLVAAPLAAAGLALFGLWLLNRFAVTRVWPYVAVGGTPWVAMLSSGFEAALAGVLIGIAETAVARLVDPGLTIAVTYALFLVVLLWRPTGLFGRPAR